MRFLNNRWVAAAGKIAQDEELREHARQALAAVGAALPSLVAIKERVATVIREDATPLPRKDVEAPRRGDPAWIDRCDENSDVGDMTTPPHRSVRGME